MIIIYEVLPDHAIYKFVRLNFDSGEFDIVYTNFDIACDYIIEWRNKGYTFIHR